MFKEFKYSICFKKNRTKSMKKVRNLAFKLLSILLINIFVLEILSFILIKINLIPSGLTPMVAFVADEDFAVSRKKNTSFKFSSKCWDSEVYYNNDGIRSSYEIKLEKDKKRVILLGDSMTENYQLSDGNDLASHLQKELGKEKFEVINYGFSSTGIAEHVNLYKQKIKDLKPDFLIYFPDTTDISDNYFTRRRPNQKMYKIINNNPVELKKNQDFWRNYNSRYNKIKRKYGYYIKKYSSFYKLYWAFSEELYVKRHNKAKKKKKAITINSVSYKEQKMIYKYLAMIFKQSIDREITKLIVVKTLKSTEIEHFRKKDSRIFNDKIKFFQNVWRDENYFDPMKDAIKYLKQRNKYSYPYLSFDCDPHYDKEGAMFYSKFISEKIF